MNTKKVDQEARDWGYACGVVAALAAVAAGVACLFSSDDSK